MSENILHKIAWLEKALHDGNHLSLGGVCLHWDGLSYVLADAIDSIGGGGPAALAARKSELRDALQEMVTLIRAFPGITTRPSTFTDRRA